MSLPNLNDVVPALPHVWKPVGGFRVGARIRGVRPGTLFAPAAEPMAKSRKHGNDEMSPEVPAAPQSAGDTMAAAADRDRVAARAYELYVARGGEDGADMEDWLAAERELSSGRTNE